MQPVIRNPESAQSKYFFDLVRLFCSSQLIHRAILAKLISIKTIIGFTIKGTEYLNYQSMSQSKSSLDQNAIALLVFQVRIIAISFLIHFTCLLADASSAIQDLDRITISYAKFGEGRHHGRVENYVEDVSNKEGVKTLLTSRGLQSKNPSGKPRPILRITYSVKGKIGTLELKYGQQVDLRDVIMKHAKKNARPHKTIEITYALFGDGPNKVRCEEQVTAVASQVDIVTPITTHGLSLRNPSGRVRKFLVFKYKVDDVVGEMSFPYGKNVDLRKVIIEHAKVSPLKNIVRRDDVFSDREIDADDKPDGINKTNDPGPAMKDSSKTVPLVSGEPLQTGDATTVTKYNLPAKFDAFRTGANGTMLFFYIRGKSIILVFDVLKNKAVKEIPVTGNIAFAANRTHLVIIRASSHIAERWNLKSLERELVEPFDREFKPTHAVMGNAGDGPLLVLGNKVQLWNVKSLKKIQLVGNLLNVSSGFDRFGRGITVSANGKFFCYWTHGLFPQHFYVINVTPTGITFARPDETVGGWAFPNADGSQLFFGGGGVSLHNLKPLVMDQFSDGELLPTQSESFFLFVQGKDKSSEAKDKTSTVSICSTTDFGVIHKIAQIPDVLLRNRQRTSAKSHLDVAPLSNYLPDHNLLISILNNKSEVLIHRFNLKTLVESQPQQLFVISKPKSRIKHQETFTHQIRTLSSSGVTFKLLDGPEGAKVTSNGLVSWKPTSELPGRTVSFQIKATNEEAISKQIKFELEIAKRANPEDANIVGLGPKKGWMAKYVVPEHVIPFPERFSQVQPAKAGQLLVFKIPTQNKLAVVDVKLRKIVKEIPASSTSVYAGNLNYLVIADPIKKTLSRYDLSSFEPDRQVELKGDFPTLAVMGASGDGPLALWSDGDVQLWDVNKMIVRPKRGDLLTHGKDHGFDLNVSADGKTFCGFTKVGAHSFDVMRVGKRWSTVTKGSAHQYYNQSWIMPGPKGGGFYRSGPERFDFNLKPLKVSPALRGYSIYPTFSPNFSIAINEQNVQFRSPVPYSEALICAASDLSVLKKVDFLRSMTTDLQSLTGGRLGYQPRANYYPQYSSLVYFPDSNDQVLFRDLTLEVTPAVLPVKPYVNIISKPESVTLVGTIFRYSMESLSHSNDFHYELVSGPDGMAVSPNGEVRWDVKSRPISGKVSVAVAVKVDGVSDTQRFDLEVKRNISHVVDEAKLGFSKIDSFRLELPGRITGRTKGLDQKELILVGKKLAILKSDGWTVERAVQLDKEYSKILERKNYYIAMSPKSSSIDILKKETFEVIRTKRIDAKQLTDIAQHPTLPVSFVAYQQGEVVPRYRFIRFDEVKMEIKDDSQWVGNWIAVDPSGQHLITGYADSYRRGAEILIDREAWRLSTEYGSLAWLIRYRLDGLGNPSFDEARQRVGVNGLGIRLSDDGSRVTYLSFKGFPNATKNQGGFNAFDFRAIPVLYPTNRRSTCWHLDFHPTLPLVVSMKGVGAAFYHREKGKIETNRLDIDPADMDGIQNVDMHFSPDGENLIVWGVVEKRDFLHKIPLKLSDAEIASNHVIRESFGKRRVEPKLVKIDLADIKAFGGSRPNKMTMAEVAKSFTNSVVVTQSANSSGSGFVIGPSGYIVTCAHCIPNKSSIKVTYQSQDGKAKTVDAKFVASDRSADLALIKIETDDKLQPVILAVGKDVELGESVSVIGNPIVGDTILNHTMTEGIVSSPNRLVDGAQFIQSSAAVNPGSSGGPMFNDFGQVIGIVVLKARIEGTGFAIPGKTIASFLLDNIKTDPSSLQLVRHWYESSGKDAIVAKYISYKDQKVTVERVSDGKRLELNAANLSRQDRKFVELLKLKLSNEKNR